MPNLARRDRLSGVADYSILIARVRKDAGAQRKPRNTPTTQNSFRLKEAQKDATLQMIAQGNALG